MDHFSAGTEKPCRGGGDSARAPASPQGLLATKSLLQLLDFSLPLLPFLPQRFLIDSAAHHIATRQMRAFCPSSLVLDVGEFCDRGSGEGGIFTTIGAIKSCPCIFSLLRGRRQRHRTIYYYDHDFCVPLRTSKTERLMLWDLPIDAGCRIIHIHDAQPSTHDTVQGPASASPWQSFPLTFFMPSQATRDASSAHRLKARCQVLYLAQDLDAAPWNSGSVPPDSKDHIQFLQRE